MPGATPAQFSVTPDGAAAYSVPLMVPPGTAGMQPRISLVYSSRGGNSPFGFGWSLSGLSQIQRGPRNLDDNGIVRGVALTSEDALFLDGEQLVEVASANAATRVFRSRIDGLYRITSYGNSATGPAYFVVETRAGLRMRFGSSANSRVSLPSGETITWLCDRIEDRSGNYMTFTYRFGQVGGQPTPEYVLERVDYTGNDAAGLAPYASVVFSYDSVPSYGSRYILGQRIDLTLRLREIVSSYRNRVLRRYTPSFASRDDSHRFDALAQITEAGERGSAFRPTQFAYPTDTPAWRPTDLMETVRDLPDLSEVIGAVPEAYRYLSVPDGTGTAGAILVAARAGGKTLQSSFVFERSSQRWTRRAGLASPVFFSGPSGPIGDVVVVDANGDGRDEILSGGSAPDNPAGTYTTNGNTWDRHPAPPFALRGRSLRASGVLEVDVVDAAGQQTRAHAWDYVGQTGRERGAVQWDGSRWNPLPNHRPPHPLSVGNSPTIVGAFAIDVDCDGIRELVYLPVAGQTARLDIYKATAGGWRQFTDPRFQIAIPELPSNTAVRIVDVNGDRCADLVYAFETATGTSAGMRLARSTGWDAGDPRILPDVVFWRRGDTDPLATSGDLADLDLDDWPDFFETRNGQARAFRGDANGWQPSPLLRPPADLQPLQTDRELFSRFVSLTSGPQAHWLALAPNNGSLVPLIYSYSQTSGWEREQSVVLPVNIAVFDKVDLGVRFIDLNNDGHPDLIWSRRRNDGSIEQAAYLFEPEQPNPWRRDDRFILPAALVREDYRSTGLLIADVNGDGRVDLLLGHRDSRQNDTLRTWINCAALPACANVAEGAVSGFWLPATAGNGFAGLAPPVPFAEDGVGPRGAEVRDMNGDGLTDLVVSRLVEHWVPVDENGGGPGGQTTRPVYELDSRAWINVDGRAWQERPEFRLAVPLVRPVVRDPVTRQGDEEPFPGVTVVETRVQLMDLDGDRLQDVAYNYVGFERRWDPQSSAYRIVPTTCAGARLGLSRASAALVGPAPFDCAALAQDSENVAGYAPPARLDDDPSQAERQFQFEDLNGDGNIDLLLSGGSAARAYLNSGRGWVEDTAYAVPQSAIRTGGGDQGFRLMDINGDALPDLIYGWTTEGGSRRGAFINTGTGWHAAPASFAPTIPLAEHDRGDTGVRPIDLDGDGLLDLVQAYRRSDSDTARRTETNAVSRAYLLVRITDGVGSRTEIGYRSFLAFQRPAERAPQPHAAIRSSPQRLRPSSYPIIHAPLPGSLVAETTSTGPGIAPRTTRYGYDGYRVNIRSGRSLGFEEQIIDDVDRGRRTVMTFDQRDQLLGSPIQADVRQGTALISSTAMQWIAVEQPGLESTSVPGFVPVIIRRLMIESQTRSFDLEGTLLGSQQDRLTYDSLSNVTRVLTAFADGSASETVNTYDDDPGTWALGRLKHARVTLSTPGQPDQVREAAFDYDQAGLLQAERALAGTELELVSSYGRDRFGNRISIETARPDGTMQRRQMVEFDLEGRFEIASINALGHRAQTRYDALSGVPLERRDPNGVTLGLAYDDLQRLTAEVGPTGLRTRVSMEPSQDPRAAYVVSRVIPRAPQGQTWIDAAGRTVKTRTTGWRGRAVITESHFDVLGRATFQSLPRFEGDAPLGLERTYDGLDRVLTETRADGQVRSIEYRGTTTIGRDQAGRQSRNDYDLRGRLVRTVDALGGVTEFTYDAGSRIRTTRNALGQVTEQVFDLGGRRTGLADPTVGTWRYEHNLYGELTAQIDPRGARLELDYDALGRLLTRRAAGQTATWAYDGRPNATGRLTRASTQDDRVRTLDYDRFGRVAVATIRIGRDALTIRNWYDLHGRLERRAYSTGVTVHNSYDDNGYWTGVALADGDQRRDVYRLLDVDAAGRVREEVMGQGIVTRTTYDLRTGQLLATSSASPRAEIQTLALTYDISGNIVAAADAATGERTAYGYDGLNRLTSVARQGAPAVSGTYDALGNVLTRTGVGTYRYCDTSGLRHVLCDVSGPGGVRAFQYDGAGNTTRMGRTQVEYDVAGRVTALRDGSSAITTFSYDSNGAIEARHSRNGATEFDVSYFGDIELLRENFTPPHLPTSERTRVRHFLAAPSGTIGFYEKNFRHYPYRFVAPVYGATVSDIPERVTDLRTGLVFFVNDQIRSLRATVSETGEVLERFAYDPWGVRIDGPEDRYRSVRQGYTGHESIDDFALVHMGGRVYSPELGRFLSPDPLVQMPGYSQSHNRYAYVLNNPLVLIDPTGFGWFSDAVGGFFRAVSGAASRIFDVTTGKPLSWLGEQLAKGGRWLEQNWQVVAIIAISVAMPGAGTLVGVMLQGAAIGGLSAALYGGGPDEIFRGALIGAATSGAFYGVGSAGIENQVVAAGAHGAVGGLSSVAQGGEFHQGFLSAALTKYSSNHIDPNGGRAYQITAAAVVGGVAAEVGGGNFENGAITGAFSRMFNDLADHGRQASRGPAYEPGDYSGGGACAGSALGVGISVCPNAGGPADIQISFSKPSLLPVDSEFGASFGFGPSGTTVGANLGVTAGYGLLSASGGAEVNFTHPVNSNLNLQGRVGPVTLQYKIYPMRFINDFLYEAERNLRNNYMNNNPYMMSPY